MEFAAHDGWVCQGLGLSCAVQPRCGHLYASLMGMEYAGILDRVGTIGKAEHLVTAENRNALRDSAILCAFSTEDVDEEPLELSSCRGPS